MTLKQYLFRCRKQNLHVLVWITLGSICLTVWGLSVANALTALVNLEIKQFIFWIVMMGGIFLLWVLQVFMEARQTSVAVQAMNIEMRKDISQIISQYNYEQFHQKEEGTYVSWLVNDIATINEYGFRNLSMIISQCLNIIFSSIALLGFHYSLNISVFILAIFMIIIPRTFKRKMDHQLLKVTNANEKITTNFSDIINGFDTVFPMNLTRYIVDKTNEQSKNLAKEKVKFSTIAGAMSATTNGTSLISQILIIVLAGVLYFMGLVPIGAVSAAQYFSATIFTSLTGLSANLIELQTTKPIFNKFTETPLINNKDKINVLPLNELIELTNVTYKYPASETPIIENMSMKIKKGKKYAIVGESGKGKTTLLKLIMGYLSDYEGNIKFDNINYEKINFESIRDQIIYINQKPHIFNVTIEENITLGQDYSKDEINCVIEELELSQWIESLPDGLQTKIKYNGSNLSGGQSQKIALARGLITGKQIILFDEGTSSLDKKAASSIEQLLISSTLTVLMITHHLDPAIASQLEEVYRI